MTRIARLSFALFVLTPLVASAQARVLQFRSIEDPASPPDPAVCAAAPFGVNVRLGGSLYTYETRRRDGQVETDEPRRIGHATACARITSLAFPQGLQQNFYMKLSLPDGDYTALGTCTIISNDTPSKGLVLAGCNLKLATFPEGVVGGAVASLTTFNPFRLAGFATGSYYTVQIYDAGHETSGEQDSDHAIEWTEGADDNGR